MNENPENKNQEQSASSENGANDRPPSQRRRRPAIIILVVGLFVLTIGMIVFAFSPRLQSEEGVEGHKGQDDQLKSGLIKKAEKAKTPLFSPLPGWRVVRAEEGDSCIIAERSAKVNGNGTQKIHARFCGGEKYKKALPCSSGLHHEFSFYKNGGIEWGTVCWSGQGKPWRVVAWNKWFP